MIVSASLSTQAKSKTEISSTYNLTPIDDSLGLPGDNLDLAAVLNIFKESKNVEDFEKNLNNADNKVNNLDLNHDGKVDYIRVIETGNDTLHNLILQVPVSRSQSQDVAVIQIQKKGDKTIHLQIVGDETLYGKNYIIEPQDAATTQSQQNTGNTPVDNSGGGANTSTYQGNGTPNYENNSPNYDNSSPNNYDNTSVNGNYGYNNSYYGYQQPNVYVNVWGWPCVSLMFGMGYSNWVSPWYWGYYPMWWNPWSPFGGYAYHQRMMGYGYYGYYRRINYNRMGGAYSRYYNNGREYSHYVQRTANRSGGGFWGRRVDGGGRWGGNQGARDVQRQPQGGYRNNGGNNSFNNNQRQPQGGVNRQNGGGNNTFNNNQRQPQGGGNRQFGGGNNPTNNNQHQSQPQGGGNRQFGGGNNMNRSNGPVGGGGRNFGGERMSGGFGGGGGSFGGRAGGGGGGGGGRGGRR